MSDMDCGEGRPEWQVASWLAVKRDPVCIETRLETAQSDIASALQLLAEVEAIVREMP